MNQNLTSFFSTLKWDNKTITRCECYESECLKRKFNMKDIFDGKDFVIEVCNTTLRLIASTYENYIDNDIWLNYDYSYKDVIIEFIKLCYIKILKDKYSYVPKFHSRTYHGRNTFDATYSDYRFITDTICDRPHMSVNITLRDYIEMHIDNQNRYSGTCINFELNSIYKDLSDSKKKKVKNVIPHWEDLIDNDDSNLKILGAIQEINKLHLS